MIDSLNGTILEKSSKDLVVSCGGVGYYMSITPQTAGALPAPGEEAMVYTHMQLAENDISLYGFYSRQEKEIFRLLISVSGVGPRVAMAILSALSPEKIVLAASAGDFKAFTAANGVGPKLAQRLILELKDKVGKGLAENGGMLPVSAVGGVPEGPTMQAVAALVSLGYSQSDAAVAVSRIDSGLPLPEIIRLALRGMGGN